MRDDVLRLKEDLCHFAVDMAKDGVDPRNVEAISAAVVGAEKILKMAVLEMELEDDGGYSGGRDRGGRYTVHGVYGDCDDYEDGDSWKRDSRGRYSRGRPMDGESYGRHWVRGHYSRDDGKRDMGEAMRRMLDDASPEERKAMERMLANMERA